MRLSAEPKGNSMKYAKQGAHEFVSFKYSDVTLENIKRSCKVHYQENLTTCDILVSEQGPSCSRLDQISSLKVIYVCFIMPEPGKPNFPETLELDSFQSQPQHKKMQKSIISHSVISPICTIRKYRVFGGAKKPFISRYVEIYEDHQICRKENSQCLG